MLFIFFWNIRDDIKQRKIPHNSIFRLLLYERRRKVGTLLFYIGSVLFSIWRTVCRPWWIVSNNHRSEFAHRFDSRYALISFRVSNTVNKYICDTNSKDTVTSAIKGHFALITFVKQTMPSCHSTLTNTLLQICFECLYFIEPWQLSG